MLFPDTTVLELEYVELREKKFLDIAVKQAMWV